MARDVYHMTIATPVIIDAASGPDITCLSPIAGISVTVYARGTTNTVQIFQRPTGATEGPTPETGATGGPNPFTTGPSGNVEFWCDGPAELDVVVADTQAPARIPTRTFGFNPFPSANRSVPTVVLAQDGNLALPNMGADVQRQWVQVGQVISWWRPQDSVPLPSGFEICDGRQIPAGQHEFAGVTGAINVPNLINRMILGADPTKAYATGANQGDAATDGPAIGGSGGSNAAKNFAHGHGVPGVSHQHLTTTPDHLHGVGSLYTGDHSHAAAMSASNSNTPGGLGSGGWASGAYYNHVHSVWTGGSGAVGIGGATGAADRALAAWSGGPSVALDTATNSLTWTANPGTDMRPRYYGLLKLIKVRRA